MRAGLKQIEILILVFSLSAVGYGFSKADKVMPASEVFLASAKSGHPKIDAIIAGGISPNQSLSLVTEPDANTAPVLSMIAGARSSIDLVMYSLNDQKVEDALVSAKNRGIAVRVLIDAGYQGAHTKGNAASHDYLAARGVDVQWTPSYFALTHQKTLIVDDAQAFIMTFNLDKTYYKKDRDFGVIDPDSADVAAIEGAFQADWQGQKTTADDGDDLVWSPGSSGELLALIASAKQSLLVYNEEMNDADVESALSAAATRGVNVEVVMTDSDEWHPAFAKLEAAGVRVRTLDPKASIYIHAKMIVADGAVAFLGSENFSDASLDDNRELGIVFTQQDIIAKLTATFQEDFGAGKEFSAM